MGGVPVRALGVSMCQGPGCPRSWHLIDVHRPHGQLSRVKPCIDHPSSPPNISFRQSLQFAARLDGDGSNA